MSPPPSSPPSLRSSLHSHLHLQPASGTFKLANLEANGVPQLSILGNGRTTWYSGGIEVQNGGASVSAGGLSRTISQRSCCACAHRKCLLVQGLQSLLVASSPARPLSWHRRCVRKQPRQPLHVRRCSCTVLLCATSCRDEMLSCVLCFSELGRSLECDDVQQRVQPGVV